MPIEPEDAVEPSDETEMIPDPSPETNRIAKQERDFVRLHPLLNYLRKELIKSRLNHAFFVETPRGILVSQYCESEGASREMMAASFLAAGIDSVGREVKS